MREAKTFIEIIRKQDRTVCNKKFQRRHDPVNWSSQNFVKNLVLESETQMVEAVVLKIFYCKEGQMIVTGHLRLESIS